MNRVFVIGTVHADSGLANASALLSILERINPEVIFLEMPPAALADHFNGKRSNLETTAASRYRASHRVTLVPVDLPTPTPDFFTNNAELHRRVERTSRDYRRLMDRNSLATMEGGFPYLNSDLCSQSWAAIDAEVRATLEYIGNAQLHEFYDRWRGVNEDRDREMLKSIEDYCGRHVFDQAVFLVGAAHRGSMVEKARAGHRACLPTVQWDFEGVLNGPEQE